MSSSSGLPVFPNSSCKRLKFLHITKTAGTSIEEAAFKSESNEMSVNTNILWGRYDKQLRACATDNLEFWHLPPKFLDYKTFTSLLQKYDFFVTVRNPYERVVSEYYCKWGGPETKAVDVAHFNRFIYDRMEEVEGLINGNNKIEGHFTPQYMYMYDRQGKRIVSEQNVVHIEQLAIEFDALMERYGLAIRAKDLGQTNKCTVEKKFKVADINPRTINIIQRVYKKDFELFGYSLAPEDSMNGPVMAVSNISLVPPITSNSDVTNDKNGNSKSSDDKADKKRDSTESSAAAAEVHGGEVVDVSEGTSTEVIADEDKPPKKQKV